MEFRISLFIMLLIFVIGGAISYNTRVDTIVANRKIAKIIGTTDYKVVEKSNDGIFFGDPHDVKFVVEYTKDGAQVTSVCRCTDSAFQPLICRVYSD